MHLSSLVEMVESGFDDRILLGGHDDPSPERAGSGWCGPAAPRWASMPALVYVGENHPLLPVALFSAAWAGVPFVPVNYRLEDSQLNASSPAKPVRSCSPTPTTARADRRRRRR